MNHPARIPAELRSRNRNFEPHFLLWKTNRIRRPQDGGWNQTKPSTRRRYSLSHRRSRDNRLQPVRRDGVGFIPNLENNKFLGAPENLVETSVER